MRRIGISQLRVVALTLALLLPCVTSSRAATSKEEICDANADFALGLEDYPAAIALHQKVLRAHSDEALAHYHLGFAYGMTGRTTEEIGEYLEAARLRLDKWDLFLNLGLAYLGENDWPKAIKALQTAVSLGRDHPEAHFNLAIAYEKGHRLREALLEITASLQLAPEDPDERNTKAIICVELGDLVCARDEWAHLLEVAPDYAPARANLLTLNGSQTLIQSSSTSTSAGGVRVPPDQHKALGTKPLEASCGDYLGAVPRHCAISAGGRSCRRDHGVAESYLRLSTLP